MKTIFTIALLALAAFAQDTTIHSVTFNSGGAYIVLNVSRTDKDGKPIGANSFSVNLTNPEMSTIVAKDAAAFKVKLTDLAKRRTHEHRDSLDAKRVKAK